MKNELLAALRAKFPDISAAILSRIADKLAKTVFKPEEVSPSIEGVTIQSLIDSYSDLRATEASQTAVINYEKKYRLKTGKAQGGEPEVREPNRHQPESSAPIWAKTLLAVTRQQVEATKLLQQQLYYHCSQGHKPSRYQLLEGVLSKLPQSLRRLYSPLPLAEMSEMQFESFFAEIKAEVERINLEIGPFRY